MRTVLLLVCALFFAGSGEATANTIGNIDASSGGGLGSVGPATIASPTPAQVCWACNGSGLSDVTEFGLAQEVTFNVSFDFNQPIEVEFSTNSTGKMDLVAFDVAITNNTNSRWNTFLISVGSAIFTIGYTSAAGSTANPMGFLTATADDDGYEWFGNCPSPACPSRASGIGTETFTFILGIDSGASSDFTLLLTPNGILPSEAVSGTPSSRDLAALPIGPQLLRSSRLAQEAEGATAR